MTPDIAALKALVELAEKATPGPWQSCTREDYSDGPVLLGDDLRLAVFYENQQADCDFSAAARNAMPALSRLLEAQSSDAAHKDMGWISCSERMPEKGERVIVWYYCSCAIAGVYEGGGSWKISDGLMLNSTKAVTHWMKPHPPSEGESHE